MSNKKETHQAIIPLEEYEELKEFKRVCDQGSMVLRTISYSYGEYREVLRVINPDEAMQIIQKNYDEAIEKATTLRETTLQLEIRAIKSMSIFKFIKWRRR